MSAEPDPDQSRRAVIAILAGLVIVALVVLFYVSTRPDSGDVGEVVPTTTPTEATPTATPATEAPTTPPPTATPTPSSTAPASPTAEPAGAQPTDADIDEFVSTYGPGDHTATGDIDGDGLADVVVATRRDETTRIEVGFWDGSAFVHHADEGGPASTINTLTIEDFNGVGGAEIVTEQSVGEAGRSISVWGGRRNRLVRQTGKGGCWDGFHTYGISGATIEQGRITATCDGSPLPPEAWSRDVYEWDGAWRFTESITPEEAS